MLMLRRLSLALAALILAAGTAGAQQSLNVTKATIGTKVYDSTAGNTAGTGISVTGTFPKQTITSTVTGTVTSVATGACVTGGAITSTGTIAGSNAVNAQTGTTYTVLNADQCKLVTISNASAIAVTLPQAGAASSFLSGWMACFQDRGAGTATITPTTSTIDGAASLALATGQGVCLYSDGTNYFTQRGMGSGGAGTVTSVATSTGITGGTITGSGTVRLVAVPPPGGRLTLVSATPVMTSDQTAKSQVFYPCYINNGVPYYDGTNDQLDTIASCEVSLTMATSGTGVTNSAGVFDIFWVHAGASRICVVTNGSGGGWASDTSGTNTQRGTGYSAVHNTRGYWTNTNSITNCYNGTTNYGSIAADQGTYLGTVYTTAAGQTGMAFKPAATVGGTNNVLGLYNAYNRVQVRAMGRDSTSTWTYSSATWRSANNSTSNRISWVDGLQQSSVECLYEVLATMATNGGTVGVNLDATTGTPAVLGFINVPNGAFFTVADLFQPQIGLHFLQAMEATNSAATLTFFGSGLGSPTGQTQALIVDVTM